MAIKHADSSTFNEIKQKGLVLVDFYADWCGPCQMLVPTLERLSEANSGADIVKLNVDNAEDVAMEYGVMSIPTMILFKDGQKVDQKVGVISYDDIHSWIQNYK